MTNVNKINTKQRSFTNHSDLEDEVGRGGKEIFYIFFYLHLITTQMKTLLN